MKINIPEWIVELNVERVIMDIEKIEGGIVSDVWRIQYESGDEYVVRRTEVSNYNKESLTNNLEKAIGTQLLPHGFRVLGRNDYIITYYSWIHGEALKSFSKCLPDVIQKLSEMHAKEGFANVKSIYRSVFDEAEFILKNIQNYTFFSFDEKCSIEHAASMLLDNLKKEELFALLDCRGRMTHGDPKPSNVILFGDTLQFIDWDKICSLSPECDIVYSLFTGNIIENSVEYEINDVIKYYPDLSVDLLRMAIRHLPNMYLIHDAFICMRFGKRYKYLKEQVFPLWNSWKYNKVT